MDRYIVREPRSGADCLRGNQLISPNTGSNNVVMETMYFGGYGAEFPGGQSVYMAPPMMNQSMSFNNQTSGQGQNMMSGIDPRYLSAYADNAAAYNIAGQRPPMQQQRPGECNIAFVGDYQNRNFSGVERSKTKMFPPQPSFPTNVTTPKSLPKTREPQRHVYESNDGQVNSTARSDPVPSPQVHATEQKSVTNVDLVKKEFQNSTNTRMEKLKMIQKTGPRAFSGPVEKVLKWHKALQDVGILILYEIVGKCVNIRSGDSCSKNLVIRDENGPAMQVVYYEIDFLLPELKPPCTVRVIGRIMPGTCRLQAFNVRMATGDDVAILPRRAAVATHHVSKICKEFGITL